MHDKTIHIENVVVNQRSEKLGDLLWLWRYVWKNTQTVSCIYLGLFIAMALIRPISAWLWASFITEVEMAKGNQTGIFKPILIVFGFCMIKWLSDILESILSVDGNGDMEQLDAVQANRQQEKMHASLFLKFSKLHPELYEIPRLQNRINRTFEFAGDRENGVNRTIMLNGYAIVSEIISLMSVSITLALINVPLALVTLVTPIPLLFGNIVRKKRQLVFIEEKNELERKISYLQELMKSSTNKELRIKGAFDFIYDKWKEEISKYAKKEKDVIVKNSTLTIILDTFTDIVSVCGYVLSILLFIHNRITLSELTTAIYIYGLMLGDMCVLLEAISEIVKTKADANSFRTVMEMPEVVRSERKKTHSELVKLDNVYYRYPFTENYILKNISLSIKSGEKIAIVGLNGAGKTTLVKMVLGMVNPSMGNRSIYYRVTGERDTDREDVSYGMVSQNPVHYISFSIAENVYLGNTIDKPNYKRIKESIDFVSLSRYDMDSVLGKEIGGIDLSTGEWQKLSIAKAIYRDAEITVLDEPTSGLDPIMEKEIYRQYLSFGEDKTVIYVTHRMLLAELAERVIVIDHGEIVEDGTPGDLLNKKGKFHELYHTQRSIT